MVSAITKTLLSAYKDLEEQCKIIDGLMASCAVRSSKRDVFDCAEKMFKYTNEKIALINAKVLVDEILDKMGHKSSMICFYIDKKSKDKRMSMEVAEKQLQEFNALLFESYSATKLFDMISDSKFLMKIYSEYARRELKSRGKNESN